MKAAFTAAIDRTARAQNSWVPSSRISRAARTSASCAATAIDAREAAVRTDGFASYLPLEQVGIHHDRQVQGSDRARSTEILPWSHTIISNLKPGSWAPSAA